MSTTRRSTRASSRASSAASPAPNTYSATPLRRKAGSAYSGMQPISEKSSNAYGTASPAVLPGAVPTGQGTSSGLQSLLEQRSRDSVSPDLEGSQDEFAGSSVPKRRSARSRLSNMSSNAPEITAREFSSTMPGHMTSQFGDATFKSHLNPLPGGSSRPRQNDGMAAYPDNYARRRQNIPVQRETASSAFFRIITTLLAQVWNGFKRFIPNPYTFVTLLTALLIFYSLSQVPSNSLISSSRQKFDNFFKTPFIPNFNYEDDSNPLQTLAARVTRLENEVGQLKERPGLAVKDVKYLLKTLPDFLVVKKDKKGQQVIPHHFWHALKTRIQDESPILKDYFIKDGTAVPAPTGTLTEDHVRKIARNAWSDFIRQNRIQVSEWYKDKETEKYLDDRVHAALKDGALLSKTEFITMLEDQWNVHRKDIKAQLRQLSTEFNTNWAAIKASADAERVQGTAPAISESHIRELAKAESESLYERIRIQALAQASIEANARSATRRVNWFSRSNGAVINPYATGDTFVRASSNQVQWALNLIPGLGMYTRARGAATALERWSEAGDCWCGKWTEEKPTDLGVGLREAIYLDSIAIDHITPDETLDFVAAPRDLEVFGHFEDPAVQSTVHEISSTLFGDEPNGKLGDGYVRLGRFSYDTETESKLQVNHLQIDLAKLGAATRQVVVRVARNGGTDHSCFYRVLAYGERSRS